MIKISLKKRWQKILSILFLLLLTILITPSIRFSNDYSVVVLDKDGQILRIFLNKKDTWRLPPAEDKIPKKLEQAVLQFEDRYFYYHPGVNIFALSRALWQNLNSREIVSGASTISMQVARISRPKARTYLNKFLEILQALKLELFHSKKDILNIYLNNAPYGGNIVGYRAASLRYFRKMPQSLSWSEAATLAVLPNAPSLISPTVNPQKLRQKRDRLLRLLRRRKIISPETYTLALLESIPQHSFGSKIFAAHLARSLHTKFPRKSVLQTTIDRNLQQQAEGLTREHSRFLRSLGINEAAVLIAETQSGKVRAYVGSVDFWERQVDGVQAPRSSGSILKPFLFALSMDNGLLLPQTLIQDVPSFFGSFSPANANRRYSGITTARQALVRSLNVPAVRLLNKFGLQAFYYFLQQGGLRTLFRPADEYGLPLILGGAEVNLWDMCTLFRGLGREGRFSALSVLQDAAAKGRERRLISQGAAWLTLDILKEVKRPGAEYYWRQYQNQWPLAWKTGTSYGQRDGWAIGVNPQWTIGVWVGNFEGQGNANLSGAACAGPLLFAIFRHLPKNAEQAWFKKPGANLQQVRLCRESGFIAGEYCPHSITAEAPAGMKPLAVCPYHKQIYVNKAESEQVCSLCWQEGDYKAVTRLIYPPQVSYILRKNGRQMQNIPPHRKSCPGLLLQNPLKIVYPRKNASIWVPRDIDGNYQKVTCRAAHRLKGSKLYWYLDTFYKGSSSGEHVLALKFKKGRHMLEVVDESGNRDKVSFFVNLRE